MDGPVRMVGVLLFLWVNQTVVSVLGIPATVLLFGEIRTPNYPKAYPEYNRTVWELAVPKGFLLKLTFKYFNPGVMGYVSGWGITERYKLSNQLKYVALPVVDQHQCNASIYRSQHATKDIPQLTDYMFCAGRVEGGEDTCSGDSGGAFTLLRGVEGGGEEYYAAGIVSWGMDCGKKGNYGVYTRVERYLGWINQTIQGN
ncbi:UNVERIFIED_CONTAM: hypothetical protein FKN15_007837 [Acipenser sinensis]